ncbi:hypothetical protein QJS77_05435 [Enterococcus faecium]|uniref:hypothetical protein n=1 Tax=Enterococcus faecium TaxID=1352 RepID=UPI001C26EF11|nr:hypothetical protein [Enterococcus faecium]MBU9741710.1 hypothetical protein [Enterococcus faecium]
MSETIENIKKFNIGDRVTSTHSILLDRGFRGVTGVIKTIVLDGRTWQYLIELDDGRELQCDDWHLEQPQLNDNQKIVLDILKDIQNKWPHFHPSTTIGMMVEMQNEFYEELSKDQELEVLSAFAQWGLEQEEAE